MPRKTKTQSLYSLHPGVAYVQAIIQNLPTTTGKSIEEWMLLLKKSGVEGAKEQKEWLKKEYKLGGTTASTIVESNDKKGQFLSPEGYLAAAAGYVEAMYAGPKAALKPIHDALIQMGLSLGDDVKICPCTTIVPLYREHVFAEIKPGTRTRIDFGLALKGATRKLPPRLIDTGGIAKGNRISHRIPISSIEEIDAEVKEWARIAYDLDAPRE